jgi:hypothetical protein
VEVSKPLGDIADVTEVVYRLVVINPRSEFGTHMLIHHLSEADLRTTDVTVIQVFP